MFSHKNCVLTKKLEINFKIRKHTKKSDKLIKRVKDYSFRKRSEKFAWKKNEGGDRGVMVIVVGNGLGDIITEQIGATESSLIEFKIDVRSRF